MKRKRLDRDIWTTITRKRYVQRNVNEPGFQGVAALLTLDEVSRQSAWPSPFGGIIKICSEGMTWLELLPDGEHYMITAKMGADGMARLRGSSTSWPRIRCADCSRGC